MGQGRARLGWAEPDPYPTPCRREPRVYVLVRHTSPRYAQITGRGQHRLRQDRIRHMLHPTVERLSKLGHSLIISVMIVQVQSVIADGSDPES